MKFEPELIPFFYFISISLARISAYNFSLFILYLSLFFVGEFCIFSYLEFTYTTYITVKHKNDLLII